MELCSVRCGVSQIDWTVFKTVSILKGRKSKSFGLENLICHDHGSYRWFLDEFLRVRDDGKSVVGFKDGTWSCVGFKDGTWSFVRFEDGGRSCVTGGRWQPFAVIFSFSCAVSVCS